MRLLFLLVVDVGSHERPYVLQKSPTVFSIRLRTAKTLRRRGAFFVRVRESVFLTVP